VSLARHGGAPLVLLLAVVAALAVSAVSPTDRVTWWLEVFPVLIAVPLLLSTYRRFPLTLLAYGLIALHALILILGGAYTYAQVPLGFGLQDWLGLARNPYDRIGHFAQGFVPAILAREILIRQLALRGKWLIFIVLSVCLAISASYELLEFASAQILGQGAEQFLGTQGDPWDTQWDMTTALLGAIFALASLSRWHDRQLAALAAVSDT
jgi:putative membrane protein